MHTKDFMVTSFLSFVAKESKGLLNKQVCTAMESQSVTQVKAIHQTHSPRKKGRSTFLPTKMLTLDSTGASLADNRKSLFH